MFCRQNRLLHLVVRSLWRMVEYRSGMMRKAEDFAHELFCDSKAYTYVFED